MGDTVSEHNVVELPQGTSEGWGVRTRWSTAMASSRRPCVTNQRGDSGSQRAPTTNTRAGTTGATTIHRQLFSSGDKTVFTSVDASMPKHSTCANGHLS
jgi:hypothetical protein